MLWSQSISGVFRVETIRAQIAQSKHWETLLSGGQFWTRTARAAVLICSLSSLLRSFLGRQAETGKKHRLGSIKDQGKEGRGDEDPEDQLPGQRVHQIATFGEYHDDRDIEDG
jgi:hypothetical protein